MATASGNILPLIADGTVKALWHDILLFPPPSSSASSAGPSATSPDSSYGDVIPSYTSSFSTNPPPPDNLCIFICTRTRSTEAANAAAGGTKKPSNSAFRTRRRRLLLSGATEFDENEDLPWNMGVIPQTCVLACGAAGDADGGAGGSSSGANSAPLSAIDTASGNAGGGGGGGGSSDGFSSLFDYAPIQAIEIGSAAREVGDIYGVIPLAALPVQRPNMGGSEVSYRLIVIAADDPLMIPEASGYNGFGVATIGEGQIAEREELQEEVERWAVKCGFANRVDDWDLQEGKDADTVLIDAHRVWKLIFPTLRKPTRLNRGATFKRLDPRASLGARPGSPAVAPSRVLELVAKPAETCVISAAKSASFSHRGSARKYNAQEFGRARTVGGGEFYRSGGYGDSSSSFGNDSFGGLDSPRTSTGYGGSDADSLSPYPQQSPSSGFGGGSGGNGNTIRRAGLPPASPPVRRVHSVEQFSGEDGPASAGLSRSVTKSALVRSSTVLSKSKSSRGMIKSVSMIEKRNTGDDGSSSGRGGGSWFRRSSSKGGAVQRSESTSLDWRESDGCDDARGSGWGRISRGGGGAEVAGKGEGGRGLFTRSRTSAQLGGARVVSGGSGKGDGDLPPYAPFTRRHTHHGDGRNDVSSASETADEDLYFVEDNGNGTGLESANQKEILKARQPQRAAWMKKAMSMKVTNGLHHKHTHNSQDHHLQQTDSYSPQSMGSSYMGKDEDLYGDLASEDNVFLNLDSPAVATVQCFKGAKKSTPNRTPNRSPTRSPSNFSTRSFQAASAPSSRRASLDTPSEIGLDKIRPPSASTSSSSSAAAADVATDYNGGRPAATRSRVVGFRDEKGCSSPSSPSGSSSSSSNPKVLAMRDSKLRASKGALQKLKVPAQ
ncbi:hypothetical protein CLOM_g20666 [Closterium sp. NIES-68]|nr:hypothetical protein CLOM_g20666 [Closterium sp. NIES-68]